MKASELRIGNLIGFIPRENKIHIPVTWIPHKVVSIEIGKVKTIFPHENLAHISKPMEFTYSDIVGIPLTEEWLVKFGFELKGNHVGYNEYRISSFGVRVQWSKNNNPVSLCNNRGYIAECENVHQLQNLYFALTGKELEIK